MSISLVSTPYSGQKSGAISIRPYFDPNVSNMGLEKYGMVLFEGITHQEQLACIERNGVMRYVTGLNEFAPEVKLIKDKDIREATIKDIRQTVSQLEKELNANVVDPEDANFWDKIELLAPNNHEFWGKISIKVGNDPIHLDPAKDPFDLIKLYAIEAGGFPIVAKSYEAARASAVSPKFYLDKVVDTISTKTEFKKTLNTAIAELVAVSNKNPNKLFYIAKVLDANSAQYKKSTPNDVIYDNMDRYIKGEGSESNVRRAAMGFLEANKLDMETLKLKALVKDASFYRFISPRSDGFIYETKSQAQMGRNASDCVTFLKNPLNDAVLGDLMNQVEQLWKQ